MNGDYKECPECKEKLNIDARACACGWRLNKAPSGKSATPLYESQCQWNDYGRRCTLMGCCSPSTGGGEWYCREHYARLRGYKWPPSDETPQSYRDRFYVVQGKPTEPPAPGNIKVPLPEKEPA